MNRTLLALAATLALIAVPAGAEETAAADPMTLEQVLGAYYEAIGGLEAWTSVTSARFVGRMSAPNGMEAPFTLIFKPPRRSRLEFTVQGLTGIQAIDGKNAWQIMPFHGKTGAERMPADQARLMLEQADFDGPLIDWEEDGNTLEYLGTEAVDGAETHKIEVTLPTGEVRYYFLDAESFLPIRSTGKTTVQGQEVSFETTLGDYKEVGGLLMPYSIESKQAGAEHGQVFTLESAELDIDIADDRFKMPAGG